MDITCMEIPGKSKDIKVIKSKKLNWIKTKVTDIKSISPKVKIFTLETEKKIHIEPGQHFEIKLISVSGYEAQRSYSVISNFSDTNKLCFAVSKINNGEVSEYLHEKLEISHNLYIRGPIGKYFNLNKISKSVILIAGGIGITPFIFYLRQKNFDTKISLIYSAKNQKEYLFRKELEDKNKLHKNFNLIVTLTKEFERTWKGLNSRINNEIIKSVNNKHSPLETQYFVCGGSNFVENMSNILMNLGIDYKDIKLERFGP